MARWHLIQTNFVGMTGPAMVAQFNSRNECARALKSEGFQKAKNRSFTSDGLEWERYASRASGRDLHIPGESRALAVIDVVSGSEMRQWEATVIFWDENGNRLLSY